MAARVDQSPEPSILPLAGYCSHPSAPTCRWAPPCLLLPFSPRSPPLPHCGPNRPGIHLGPAAPLWGHRCPQAGGFGEA